MTLKIKANSELRSLNDPGKRISWCRKQLGLTITEVTNATGISRSSYSDMEYGARSYYQEVYLVLAQFFNSKWSEKFGRSFPSYEKMEITEVKTLWLLFGLMNE